MSIIDSIKTAFKKLADWFNRRVWMSPKQALINCLYAIDQCNKDNDNAINGRELIKMFIGIAKGTIFTHCMTDSEMESAFNKIKELK